VAVSADLSPAALEVFVLGPTEVRSQGRSIPIARAIERALLVRLAMGRERPVADETLLSELWGNPGPIQRLWVQTSRLRASLGEAADCLVRTSAGYLLNATVPDLSHAEANLAVVHSALSAADLEAVDKSASESLSSWRGQALADLRSFPFAEAEGTRLDLMQLEAQIERLDARLKLHRPGVRQDLEALALAQPLNERIWSLLAIARYHEGSQAAALDGLMQLRRRLADELGIDPTPATAELELRILRHDPSLVPTPASRAAPTSSAGGRRTAPIPKAQTRLFGREAELAAVLDALRGPRLVTLTGGPGSGKTRIAIEVAHAVQETGQAVVWLDLAPAQSPDGIEAALATAMRAQGDSRLAMPDFISVLDDAVLVIDNAEHLIESVADLISDLRIHCERLPILVTSQRPTFLADEETHRIGPLPAQAAIDLFNALSDNSANGAYAETICRAVDQLPLGITLAAGLTRTLSVQQIADRVEDRLRLLVGGQRDAHRRHSSLRAALDWSYGLLPDTSSSVFRKMAVFVGGCTLEAMEHVVAGTTEAIGPPAETAAALTDLADRCLLTVDHRWNVTHFGMLETVSNYAFERLRDDPEFDTVQRSHADWCVAIAETCADFGRSNHVELVRILTAEEGNLRAAVRRCLDTESAAEAAIRIVVPSGWFWWLHGSMSEAAAWLDEGLAAIGTTPTRLRGDAMCQAAALARNTGDAKTAARLGQECLEIYLAIGDAAGIARALQEQAITALVTEDYPAALNHGHAARSRAEANDNSRAIINTLNTLALISRNTGRPDEATHLSRTALDICNETDDQIGAANAVANLATIQYQAAAFAAARLTTIDALNRYAQLHVTEGQMAMLGQLGQLEVAAGDPAVGLRWLVIAAGERTRIHAPLLLADERATERDSRRAALHALGARAEDIIGSATAASRMSAGQGWITIVAELIGE